ncbi:testis-expressed protein 47-like [Sycon ciliatum]|uniref:testis-expressed protein 47-like n=1 Tax=Sycon ciliatum TaxID=27933 RepID=UPI0031F6271F
MTTLLQTSDLPEVKSLLERVLDVKKSLGMTSQLHRLILLVKLKHRKQQPQPASQPSRAGTRQSDYFARSPAAGGSMDPSRRNIIAHFDGHTKHWRDGRRGDTLTGSIVHYPDYVLCVLECTGETLRMAMVDILEDEKKQEFCTAAKMLSYGSGMKCRLFKDWTSRVMPKLQTNVMEDISEDPLSRTLPMLIECCLKLTTTLATFSKVDLSQHVDRLRENFSHLMIPKEHFDYLISEDGISSIAQFLERYRSRHEIPDENEQTWPVPALIRPPQKNAH